MNVLALAVSHHLDVLPEGVELLLELQGKEPFALEDEPLGVRERGEPDPEGGVVREDRLVLEDAPQVDRPLADPAVELHLLLDVEVRADRLDVLLGGIDGDVPVRELLAVHFRRRPPDQEDVDRARHLAPAELRLGASPTTWVSSVLWCRIFPNSSK